MNNAEENYLKGFDNKIDDVEKRHIIAELGVAMEFDEEQWYSLVDFVTVFNKEDVRFIFKDGTEIKV